jgi:hypothetical protein
LTTKNLRTKIRQRHSAGDLDTVDSYLSKTQLVILLTTIVLVPLVVLPESNFVDITSNPKTTILRMLGMLQLGVLVSRLLLSVASNNDSRLLLSIAAIKTQKPALAIIGSIFAVAIVSIISALFSIMPAQSWWGRVPASFEAGEFTALMYVIMAISTLISVQEYGRRSNFWSVLAITGILASSIGLFQFLGWSPLDISSTHKTRLTGTNGNPIFFGAMLIVLAPITIAILSHRVQTSSAATKNWWYAALGTGTFLLSLSLIATVSRGPWVGAFAGGISAIAILIYYGRSTRNLMLFGIVAATALFGALVATFVDPTPPPPKEGSESTSAANSSAVTSAFGQVGRTSTLDLRVRYWRLSVDMSTNREPVPFTREWPKIVRLLFGYGPDSFRFAGTHFADETTFTRRLTAAHNDPLNRLAEQGILGLLAWIALWISIAYGTVSLVRRALQDNNQFLQWIAIGIAAALTARFVEQLFGSPTPGGVLVFWVETGGLAALLLTSTANPSGSPTLLTLRIPKYAVYAGMLIIIIGAITVGWDRGANYLIANQMASFQFRPTVVTANEAVDRLEQATKIAPDVPRYWNDLAEIEHNRAVEIQDPQRKAQALADAYQFDLKAYEANPMEVSSIYTLAFAAWESGNLGQPELKNEAVRLYERLTQIIPSDELAKERLKILNDLLEQ